MTAKEKVLKVYPNADAWLVHGVGWKVATSPYLVIPGFQRELATKCRNEVEAWEAAVSNLPTAVELKAQVESASVDECEWCNESEASHPIIDGANGHVLRECITFEPKEVESGGLPPLPKWSVDQLRKAAHDMQREAFQGFFLLAKQKREEELKASLLREKGLRELLSRIYMSTASGHDSGYVRLYVERGTFKEIEAVFLKAAVTGE